jgi:hypothetical protein
MPSVTGLKGMPLFGDFCLPQARKEGKQCLGSEKKKKRNLHPPGSATAKNLGMAQGEETRRHNYSKFSCLLGLLVAKVTDWSWA